jgi:hypothetical protein
MGPDRVIKRFTSWARGEPQQEWRLLTVLDERAAGLAPKPLSADLTADPPTVTMSRLTGTPLGGRLDPARLDGLAAAMDRLWTVATHDLPPRRFLPDVVLETVRRDLTGLGGPVGRAVKAALSLHSGQITGRRVVGHGDSNLANYLWDGQRVAIVDFEDGGWSTIEYELASLIEHRSAADTDWDGFVARFGVEPEQVLPARVVCAALWLWLLIRRHPDSESVRDQAERVLALADQPS